MLRWTLLRMMLLLWMTRVTLQGGTGYSLGPERKMKGNGYGNPSAVIPGNNGQSANLPAANGNGAAFKGFGNPSAVAHGNNGQSASLPVANGNGAAFKGYGASAAAAQNGYGAKPIGPVAQNVYGGKPMNYGAVSGIANGQGAKPKGGIGMGMGMMNQQAASKGQNIKSGAYGVPAGYPKSGAAKGPKPGYGGPAQGPNAGSSLGYMGYPNSGVKGPQPGYGAKAGYSNGQGANPNGYGAKAVHSNVQGANPNGYGAKAGYSNGQGANPNGYGAKAGYSNGQGANSNGYGAKAGYSNGQGANTNGYGAKAGHSNGQGAKSNGYGAKAGYFNGQGANPSGYGTKAGYSNGQRANPNGYRTKAGYSNGQRANPNGYGAKAGYSNGQGPNPNGYGAKAGYSNGHGANPSGYGAKAGYSNGQGANPNGYGRAAKGPNAGNMGNPNSGIKGPKPGNVAKAGYSNGPGANPNGYGVKAGYPNGQGANPNGYGAKAGYSNRQGTNPNGYGVPLGMFKGPYTKGLSSGYAPIKNGNGGFSSGKGPKGETLSPEVQGHLPVSANMKGILPLAEHESSTRLPTDISSVMQQTKGPSALLPQGKAPKPWAPHPVLPQEMPSNAFAQGPSTYKPSKAYKPVASAAVVPQSKAFKPVAPIVSQSEAESTFFHQRKAQKPLPQVPQTVALSPEQAIPQEQSTGQVVAQPITSQSGISSMATLAQGQQSKASKPAPETLQNSPAFQPNQALTQLTNPSTTNTELVGLEKRNGQQQSDKPDKPDCRPNGQWIKLPSPGSMYPKQNGANPSQPAFGAGVSGYPVPGMNNGYNAYGAGHGSHPSAEYGNGYGNGPVGPNGAVKGKSAGPQDGLPTGLGFKGQSKNIQKYGIGGRAFGGSPDGYQSNPIGKYGNDGLQYGNKPYNAKAAGQYGFGGLPYNKQSLGYGGEKLSGKYGSKVSGFGGSPYSSQSLGTDAKPGKYGNPAVPYELLGPVTDGQSVDENRNLGTLHQGPEIDGQKSIDHFGEGEIPPQPYDPVILTPPKSADTYGNGEYTNERMKPEVVSFPAAPTQGPVPHIPPINSLDSSHTLTGSSLTPESSSLTVVSGLVESVVPDVVSEVSAVTLQPDLPTLMLQPAAPPQQQQQIQIQQHLKFHFHPHDNSQTGGKEGKYNLKGFFGNKYQG